jgi:polysaccharide biosynthesis/export protein
MKSTALHVGPSWAPNGVTRAGVLHPPQKRQRRSNGQFSWYSILSGGSTTMSRIRQIVVAATVALLAFPAAGEYRLDSGDVLEVEVFGVQDFKRRVAVNADGNLSLPLLGDIRAAGLSLTELRSELKQALAKNKIIRGPDVTADVVEYRPFFISGQIAKPGAYPYQPGLTVRQAVALAGGYDMVRFKVDNPLMMAADLRSQYETTWTEYVRREARVTSLHAELEGRDAPDLSHLKKTPVTRRVVSELVQLELDNFQTRKADYQKEKEYLQRTVNEAKDQVASLTAGQKQEAIGIELQNQNLARTSVLSKQGLAPLFRLTDEQRAIVLQRAQQLETGARLADARRIAEENNRRLGRADDERRMRLIGELQDANMELERARTQLQGIGEKLLYLGAIKTQLLSGSKNEPEISIHRRINGSETRVSADESSRIEPGDAVDVTFSIQKQLALTE